MGMVNCVKCEVEFDLNDVPAGKLEEVDGHCPKCGGWQRDVRVLVLPDEVFAINMGTVCRVYGSVSRAEDHLRDILARYWNEEYLDPELEMPEEREPLPRHRLLDLAMARTLEDAWEDNKNDLVDTVRSLHSGEYRPLCRMSDSELEELLLESYVCSECGKPIKEIVAEFQAEGEPVDEELADEMKLALAKSEAAGWCECPEPSDIKEG